jgi:hypothetical protein
MTEEELVEIESAIGCGVPQCYRDTMLAYPFPKDSFAAEVLLPNNPKHIIKMNPKLRKAGRVEKAFFTGSDETGEISYYLDASNSTPTVFRMGRTENSSADWDAHLNELKTRSERIREEMMLRAERKAHKQWWEFWK